MRCRNGAVSAAKILRPANRQMRPEEATDERCFSLSQNATTAGDAIALSRRRALLRLRVCSPRQSRCDCGRDICGDNEVCSCGLDAGAPCPCTAAPVVPRRAASGTTVATRRRSAAAGNGSTSRKGWGRGTGSAGKRRPASSPHRHRQGASHCGGCKSAARGAALLQGELQEAMPARPRGCGRTCGNPRTEACCSCRLIAREDMLSDDENCGACGSAAANPGSVCPERGKGACVRRTGTVDCSGAVSSAADFPARPTTEAASAGPADA